MGERSVSGQDVKELARGDAALGDTLPGESDSQQAVEMAATVAPTDGDPDLAELSRGSTLDHFVILEQLGVGGMGVVLAAYDPDLDRKVAIKLMRPSDVPGSSTSTARARLLREAQALAKLTHPNVTRVYEVGSFRDRVSVVMEYVQGQTLAAWRKSADRSWREVVAAFVEAGKGLAAAHAAELVHRDFKPENVLVGDDGRVLVTDFGLVSSAAQEVADDSTPSEELTVSSPLSVTLTCGGALLGTPAYMAPEQMQRQRADARSDQFSFCVALYEALYGKRPFAGKSYFELRDNVRTGTLRPTPKGADVPAWLRAVVLRGLSAEPADRFPSMDDLLGELTRDPARVRRRVALGVAGTGLAALALFGLLREGGSPPQPCAGGEAELVGVWDDDVRAAVTDALSATGRPHARETARLVSSALDARRAEWLAARVDACEDTRVRGEQSEQLMDLRIGCLDRRADETRALTELFAASADGAMVDKAANAVANLTPVSACEDIDALTAGEPVPEDPRLRPRVEDVRWRIAEIEAMRNAGRYKPGIERARALLAETDDLDYPPVRAQIELALAELEARGGDPNEGETLLYRALESAAVARDHDRVASAYIELVHVIGTRKGKPADALALRRAAETAVAQAGNHRLQRASLYTSLGLAHATDGDYGAAQELHRQAIELIEADGAGDSPRLAMALGNLASAMAEQGQSAAAQPIYERALAIQERILGPNHPQVGYTLNNLGNVFEFLGESKRAVALFERAIEIWDRALPAGHPLTATAWNNLANAQTTMGELDAARASYRHALDMLKKSLGDEHPAVAAVLGNLGEVYVEMGDHAEGLRICSDARALTVASAGAEHPDLAYSLTCIGRAQLGLGNPADARAPLTEALALRERNEGDPVELAETRFALARAIANRDRRRAIALAEQARAAYAAVGTTKAAQIESVEAALASWAR